MFLVLKGQGESACRRTIGKSVGLVESPTQEDVVVEAFDGRAAQADRRASQGLARQIGGARTAHGAGIQSHVEAVARVAQRDFQIVAPVKAPLRGQRHVPAEATYRPAIADGEEFGGQQLALGVLAVEGGGVAQRQPALGGERHGERHRERGVQQADAVQELVALARSVGHDRFHLGLAVEPGHPETVGERQVELRGAEVVPVQPADLGKGCAALLIQDLGVFDEGVAPAMADAELQAVLLELVALEEVHGPQFGILRVAARLEHLIHAGDALEVIAAVGGGGEGPVAPRHGIEGIEAARAPSALIDVGVMAVADIQEVVQPERVVDAERKIALELAGGGIAAVIERGDELPGFGTPHGDHDVRLAWQLARDDLHLDVLAGYPLHLLQALLQVPHVEQVAGACGERGLPAPAQGFISKAYLADDARDQGKAQHAGGQVLLRDRHTGGGVAPAKNPGAQAPDDGVDAVAADALAGILVQVFLCKAEGVHGQRARAQCADASRQCLWHGKLHAGNGKARRFRWQLRGQRFAFSRGAVQRHVGRLDLAGALVGLFDIALTLALLILLGARTAQRFFDVGRRLAERGTRQKACRSAKQPGEGGGMAMSHQFESANGDGLHSGFEMQPMVVGSGGAISRTIMERCYALIALLQGFTFRDENQMPTNQCTLEFQAGERLFADKDSNAASGRI
ncbi:hypothetical protein CNECB9_2360010 [Cupriavidus necator]|uniref:Uncharacterized protein n=1 Tax=Cupriavidus necator TaxID=106590 RepID=A0A1K0IDM2_CUPNE|nr:hypothetical protein CNECB9_2360010 [Cupriavidus necator]